MTPNPASLELRPEQPDPWWQAGLEEQLGQ